MRTIFISIGILLNAMTLFSQRSTLDRSEWIYWQQDKPLAFQDFKGAIGDCGPETIEDSIQMEASACLGLWSILDIPKSWKEGAEYERYYFVPVFNTKKSWAKSNDSIAIVKQQVYFDLAELSARWARKELHSLRQQAENATGTTAIYYSTIKKEMEKMKQGMYAEYFDAVFRTNNPDSLKSWVDFTAQLLDKSNEFRTKEIEFERLITGQPEKGYKQAKSIIGPME